MSNARPAARPGPTRNLTPDVDNVTEAWCGAESEFGEAAPAETMARYSLPAETIDAAAAETPSDTPGPADTPQVDSSASSSVKPAPPSSAPVDWSTVCCICGKRVASRPLKPAPIDAALLIPASQKHARGKAIHYKSADAKLYPCFSVYRAAKEAATEDLSHLPMRENHHYRKKRQRWKNKATDAVGNPTGFLKLAAFRGIDATSVQGPLVWKRMPGSGVPAGRVAARRAAAAWAAAERAAAESKAGSGPVPVSGSRSGSGKNGSGRDFGESKTERSARADRVELPTLSDSDDDLEDDWPTKWYPADSKRER